MERKSFLLRLEPATMEALRIWAGDDLRSLTGRWWFSFAALYGMPGRLPSARGARPAASSSTNPGKRGSANPERSAVAPEKS